MQPDTDTPTPPTPVFAPPTIPPPPAPKKSRKVLIASLTLAAVTLSVIGVVVATKDSAADAATGFTLPGTVETPETTRPRTTEPPRTTQSTEDEQYDWVVDNRDELLDFLDGFDVSTDDVTTSRQLQSFCRGRASWLRTYINGDAATDRRVPYEYTAVLDALERAYDSCALGAGQVAVDNMQDAVDAMRDFHYLIEDVL